MAAKELSRLKTVRANVSGEQHIHAPSRVKARVSAGPERRRVDERCRPTGQDYGICI